MKMKTQKICIVLLLLAITLPAAAQNRKIKSGNKNYYRFNYSRAIRYYEPVKARTIDLQRNLADSYVMTGKLDKALEVYEQIASDPARTFEDMWKYFQVLQRTGEYGKAMNLLPALAQLNPDDSRVKAHMEAGEYYRALQSAKPEFEVRNLKMNTKQQDFAPVIYGEKVVYATSRNRAGFNKRTWVGNQLGYLNLYVSVIDGNKEIKKGKPFNKKMNKKFHDGPVSFSADGTLMAITRNNYENKSSDGTRNLQIFVSEFVKNRWAEPVAFPYNNAEYSVGQATLTPDGRYMYFVSDMPGGKGGTDIYKIERRKDGTWGQLINLESINTEGNEMFPGYHTDGLLFFSSDGHPGLGGLDVFVAPISGEIYGTPQNMGIPINTPDDDFALNLDKTQKFGYLSSNRQGGKGSDDIYAVNVLKPLRYQKKIMGVTRDRQNNIIPGTQVVLTLDNKFVARATSDKDGKFEFQVNQEALFYLTGSKPGYEDGQNTADTDVPEEIVYADLILDTAAEFALKIIIKDRKTDNIIPGAKITIKNNITFDEEMVYTNAEGFYFTDLSGLRLNDKLSYNFEIEKKDYTTKFSSYYQILDRGGEYEVVEYMDQLKVGDEIGEIFKINPIYFDFDKHDIRPDAAMELDKIVQVMNQYPTMVIELGSHTDCRGTKEYNMALSDRRAKSSAEYIRERITNPERIYGKGYGESKLVNNCECEGDRIVPCSEEEHQMNRRTEFVIVKYDDKYKPTGGKGGLKAPEKDDRGE
jgi:outer membrane protein OmpA-like peptidoglycan-associated protein